MATLKHALRTPFAQAVIAWSAVQYVRVNRRLGRLTVENKEIVDDLVDSGAPFIVCFWHSRSLMFRYLWRYRTKMNILFSRHPDGRLISLASSHFGLASITGSSSGGGTQAIRAILRVLRAGECVAVTPDGPRGPRMRASPGVVHIARLAGVPLVPVAFSASRRRILRSWDRYMVPLPFTNFLIRVGEPIGVDRNADDAQIEAIRQHLEDRLNDMTREIDSRGGLSPVEPDPRRPYAGSVEAASRD